MKTGSHAFRLPTFIFLSNQIDHPGTISRKQYMIAGETILISGRPGSDAAKPGNHFVKSKRIAGNPKSIFAKVKNTFAMIKHYIYLFSNQFPGNSLQHG